MKTFLILIITVAAILIGCTVFAQDAEIRKAMEKAARQAYKDMLRDTDKNNDGKISKTEFYTLWKDQKVAEKKYLAWDTNKDGFITEEEYVKVILDLEKKKK
ncbi:MAG: EF-hand domain-containing protein [Bacteroidales bacterium]|nr:EF-hand domain-containing protein [Bacteroidales bacterium]